MPNQHKKGYSLHICTKLGLQVVATYSNVLNLGLRSCVASTLEPSISTVSNIMNRQ